MLHYWVFLLGYYLYVYMSYLERSMLSYFLRISIKICSVFMRAIGFLGGSGLFRTVMFQTLDFLGFFNVILSPGWLEHSALTRTMSQHIFWIYATAPMFWSLKVSHIVYHSSISWYIVKSFNWIHRNTKANSYFSEINLHVSVGRCL